MQDLSAIREHMEVIGADGVYVGTVDHVQKIAARCTERTHLQHQG